jgi:hypothetical protein
LLKAGQGRRRKPPKPPDPPGANERRVLGELQMSHLIVTEERVAQFKFFALALISVAMIAAIGFVFSSLIPQI